MARPSGLYIAIRHADRSAPLPAAAMKAAAATVVSASAAVGAVAGVGVAFTLVAVTGGVLMFGWWVLRSDRTTARVVWVIQAFRLGDSARNGDTGKDRARERSDKSDP